MCFFGALKTLSVFLHEMDSEILKSYSWKKEMRKQ